jgi:hypothetical protein
MHSLKILLTGLKVGRRADMAVSSLLSLGGSVAFVFLK